MEDQLLQPLQVDEWQGKDNGPAGTMLREKLLQLFSATDFVRVVNIDTDPFTWQYMPASKEHISFDTTTSTVPMKDTFREPPEVYRLDPGQSAIIVGASAYLMIEGLIKRVIAEETIEKDGQGRIMPGGRSRKFSFSDDLRQQQLIDRIYMGKHMPGMAVAAPPPPATIEEDLGITNAAPAAPDLPAQPVRRPPRKPATA